MTPTENGFLPINAENIHEVQQYISTFVSQTQNTYIGDENEKKKFTEAINETL